MYRTPTYFSGRWPQGFVVEEGLEVSLRGLNIM
jgi:hypothetical protein